MNALAISIESPYTPEAKAAFQHVRASMKSTIKEQIVSIRELKSKRCSTQKAGEDASRLQSFLHHDRRENRAYLLVYGMLRGKSWGQMEFNHPEGEPKILEARVFSQETQPIKSLLGSIWEKYRQEATETTGHELETPPSLAKYL